MRPYAVHLRRVLVFHIVSLLLSLSIAAVAFVLRLTLLGVIFAVLIVVTVGNIMIAVVQLRRLPSKNAPER